MAQAALLLIATTLSYAGYNVCLKLSGSYSPKSATSPVLATICIQLGAMFVSVMIMISSALKGGANFYLTKESYLFAALAGICVGFGGLGYLYIFSGMGNFSPMPANLVIPTVVSGTIVIAMFVSALVLKESVRWPQIIGSALILIGIVVLFVKTGTTTV